MSDQIQCPNCKYYKVSVSTYRIPTHDRRWTAFGIIHGIATVVLLYVVISDHLTYEFIAVYAAIGGITYLIFRPQVPSTERKARCRNCGYIWTLEENTDD